MSNKIKQNMQKPHKQIKRCLSKDDWDKMAAALMVAQELFDKSEIISDKQWQTWTSEMAPDQGFPAIIYHDSPVVIKPQEPELIHKVG
jgi:hypothetical protein